MADQENRWERVPWHWEIARTEQTTQVLEGPGESQAGSTTGTVESKVPVQDEEFRSVRYIEPDLECRDAQVHRVS